MYGKIIHEYDAEGRRSMVPVRHQKVVHLRKKLAAVILLASLLLALCMASGCGKRQEPELEEYPLRLEEEASPVEIQLEAADGQSRGEEDQTQEEETADAKTSPRTVTVHVCGAVKKEGVYTLAEGSRIRDAVEAAGGFSEEADTAYLNLAMELSDAVQIRVPTKEEAGAYSPEQSGSGEEANGSASAAEGKININTASREELMKIPGVGEVRAQRIIEYREQSGPFETIEDLMKVSGIKNASFEKMREYITV